MSGPPCMARLAVGLAIVVVLDTAIQICGKLLVARLPELASVGALAASVLSQGLAYLIVAFLVCQLANWLWILRAADLSFALPLTSLSYATVLVASHEIFGEDINVVKVLGLGCMLVGVWCVSRTAGAAAPARRERP
jgi:multidrug transporter EmrE-like cation transporter